MASSEDTPSDHNAETLSIDAGGTMTDTFLMDTDGKFTAEKAKTTPDDESRGFINSSQDALEDWDLDVEEGFPDLVSTVYSGTAMLNRLVERESEVDNRFDTGLRPMWENYTRRHKTWADVAGEPYVPLHVARPVRPRSVRPERDVR